MSDTTPREYVGGPHDGEIIVVDEGSVGSMLPVTTSDGKTLNPPRWAQYRLKKDGRMHFIADGSIFQCLEASIYHRDLD